MPGPDRPTDVLRILDANANRAAEGLRVVEDFVRFSWDDAALAQRCKQMRHHLAEALREVDPEQRAAARDTVQDVGGHLATQQEYARADAQAVVHANLKRVQQSLRTLEEFGKTLEPTLGERLERLRYDCYTLEKAILSTDRGHRLMGRAALYVLADGGPSPTAFRERVEALVAAGVDVLQLRDKRLSDRELLARARTLRELTAGSQTLFIMNDRPDLAVLACADGLHLGQQELSLKDARRVVGAEVLVGVSTHNLQQARQAVVDGANYLGVGPMFASATKQFTTFPGPGLLAQVTSEVSLPAFAIGGIQNDNLDQILATGCRRVAVAGAVWTAPDPAQAARHLLARLSCA